MADVFTAVSRFLLDEALRLEPDRALPKDPEWPTGTRVTAQVRAVMDPSRALLQIGQQVVDAKLPVEVKVGDHIPLRVVEPFPKLVFALERDQAAEAPHSQVSLSPAAKVLGDIVRTADPSQTGKPLRLALAEPLPVPSPEQPHAEALAQTLKQSLEKSGLFYEKHQARWVSGEYPLAELKQEPQARLAKAAIPPPHVATVLPESAKIERPDASIPKGVAPVSTQEDRSGTLKISGDAPSAELPLRSQMELLDGRQVTVALPGWEQREVMWELPQRENSPSDVTDEDTWSTQLRVSLPRLGAVSVQIRLQGDRVALSVATESEDGRSALAAKRLDLLQALDTAGLKLTQISVTGERDQETENG